MNKIVKPNKIKITILGLWNGLRCCLRMYRVNRWAIEYRLRTVTPNIPDINSDIGWLQFPTKIFLLGQLLL